VFEIKQQNKEDNNIHTNFILTERRCHYENWVYLVFNNAVVSSPSVAYDVMN